MKFKATVYPRMISELGALSALLLVIGAFILQGHRGLFEWIWGSANALSVVLLIGFTIGHRTVIFGENELVFPTKRIRAVKVAYVRMLWDPKNPTFQVGFHRGASLLMSFVPEDGNDILMEIRQWAWRNGIVLKGVRKSEAM